MGTFIGSVGSLIVGSVVAVVTIVGLVSSQTAEGPGRGNADDPHMLYGKHARCADPANADRPECQEHP